MPHHFPEPAFSPATEPVAPFTHAGSPDEPPAEPESTVWAPSSSTAPGGSSGASARLWRHGTSELDDTELIAAMLGGSRSPKALEAARAVLDRAGGLTALARMGPARLVEVPGLGRARAARLAASIELARRWTERSADVPRRLATPAAVAAYLAPRATTLVAERMWVLSLDGRNGLRGVRCVAQGGQHGCAVSVREILHCALADAASGFVLAHNHPSGEPSPSPEDISMTQTLARAADVVGTPLLDHVIVTASGAYSSLLDAGLI